MVVLHFNKCGVSDDKKYIMAIGKNSHAKDKSKPTWTMAIFKNHCPSCGANNLIWSIFWNGTTSSGAFAKVPCLKGRKNDHAEGGSAEGHVFCKSCDADFSVQGHDHISSSSNRMLKIVVAPTSSSKNTALKLKNYGLSYDVDSGAISSANSSVSSKTYTKGYDKDNPFKAYLKIGYSIGTDAHPYTKNSKTYYIYLDFSEDSNIQRDSFSDFSTVWVNNAFRQNSANIIEHISLKHDDIDRKNKYYLRSVSFVHDKADQDLYTKDGSDNSSCKMLLKKIGFRKGDALNPKTYETCGQTLLQSIQSILEDCTYNTEMVYGDTRYNDYLDFYLKSATPVFTLREDDVNFLGMTNINYTPLEDTHNSSYQLYKEKQSNGTNLWKYVNSRKPTSVLVYGENSVVGKMEDGVNRTEAYHKARYYTDDFTSDMPFTYTVEYRGIPPIKIGDSVKCIFEQSEYNDIKVVESLSYNCTNDDACNFITTIGLGKLAPMLKLRKELKKQRQNAKNEKTKVSGGAVYPSQNTIYEFEE